MSDRDPIVLITLGSARAILEEHRILTRRIAEDRARLDLLTRQIAAMQAILTPEQWSIVQSDAPVVEPDASPSTSSTPTIISLVQKVLDDSEAPRSAADIRRTLLAMGNPEVSRKVRGPAVHVRLAQLVQRGAVLRVGQNRYSTAKHATELNPTAPGPDERRGD